VAWSENFKRADSAIELTEDGKEQARGAGEFLRDYFTKSMLMDGRGSHIPKIRLWHSPYTRTRQTAAEIEKTCLLPKDVEILNAPSEPGVYDISEKETRKAGTPFFLDKKEHHILHEQQFGLWDGLSDKEREEQFPREWALYLKYKTDGAKVWAPLPGGESRMDVARRVHQAFGSMHRDAEKHGIHDIVVVGHGTTNRAFTFSWMHYPWEWFEVEPNPKNCSVRLIEDGEDKEYIFKGFDGGQHAGQ
jgi:2,3-bisphosphoglycerate-dependent phosphoglycerate mutase